MAQVLYPRVQLQWESADGVHRVTNVCPAQTLFVTAKIISVQSSYIFLWTKRSQEEHFSPLVHTRLLLCQRRTCSKAPEFPIVRGLLYNQALHNAQQLSLCLQYPRHWRDRKPSGDRAMPLLVTDKEEYSGFSLSCPTMPYPRRQLRTSSPDRVANMHLYIGIARCLRCVVHRGRSTEELRDPSNSWRRKARVHLMWHRRARRFRLHRSASGSQNFAPGSRKKHLRPHNFFGGFLFNPT